TITEVLLQLLPQANEQQQNFIKLLQQHERLLALPEILQEFIALKAQKEQTLDVQVTTAMPLSDNLHKQLTDALQRRFKRNITLASQVDPAILGGAIIRAGDMVIDGS